MMTNPDPKKVQTRAARGDELGVSLADPHRPLPAPARVFHEFKLPDGLDPELVCVGIVELTVQEEMWATKRAAGNAMALGYNLAMESLRYVGRAKSATDIDRQNVSTGDGTSELAFNRMTPVVRQLVVSAYAAVHQPQQVDLDGFLKSRRAVAL
jgi:hypothetical protein